MAANDCTLSEAIAEFVATLPPVEQLSQQQELLRFARWFGAAHKMEEVTPQALEAYQEQLAASGADQARALPPLRAFLAYAQQRGYAAAGLARAIKLRRPPPTLGRARTGEAWEPKGAALTPEGYAKLREELNYLVSEVRPQIARALREARADRDIRENAPYDAAKQHQAQVEARIRELKQILATAEILAPARLGDKVSLGATVVLRDLAYDEEVRYTLVSSNEASPRAGKISSASPLGKALLDRQEGEEIAVEAPAGLLRYRIERIESS